MREHLCDAARTLLAIILSLVFSLQSVPMRAIADELGDDIGASEHVHGPSAAEVPDGEPGTDDDSDSGVPSSTEAAQMVEEPMASVMDDVVPQDPDDASPETVLGVADWKQSCAGTLTEGLTDADGHAHRVTVAYDESAGIPAGAELRVRPCEGGLQVGGSSIDGVVERALGLSAQDRILGSLALRISIEEGGDEVGLTGDVTVTIETDAISLTETPYVEAVVMDDCSLDTSDAFTSEMLPVTCMPGPTGTQPPQGGTAGRMGDASRYGDATVSLTTSRLGIVALARVATSMDVWHGRGLEARLLVPRDGWSVRLRNADSPRLEEGLEALACYELSLEARDVASTELLFEARRGGDDPDAGEGLGVFAYEVKEDGDVAEDALFGPQGTEPVPFDVRDTRILFVWDSGYRDATIRMGDVTVCGMMPEGTQVVATDVSGSYDDPTLLAADAGAGLRAQSEVPELKTIAAFDISLSADGDEYQPVEGWPLTVTIKDAALKAGLDVMVMHVTDDGSAEQIEDFDLDEGSITFATMGFSTFLIAQAESQALSHSFALRAYANSTMRASTVRFVDVDRLPLYSTVSSVYNIYYTGGGTERNETNTIDMYGFIDRLDPDIADEYEFSRVFVQLSGMEKDFRYVQVADGTVTGEGDAIKRAYFHMRDISENAKGRDYYGTWYALTFSGRMDDVYVEFYHVAPVSLRAIDTRGDPVVGAEFTLFTDPDCYVPLEYKGREVTGVSDGDGRVDFGKIPRGTYYMKETLIPEGYKKSIDIYEVEVDGTTTINDVVHEDDDGSIIISDILRMTLKKEWDDGEDRHTGDSVEVKVHARGETVANVTLNAANNWTQTIDGLDPNEPYMVSETLVTSNGVEVTDEWIPDITYVEHDPHYEYYKAGQFRQGKQYVMLTTTASGTRALVGGTSLATVPLEGTGDQIAGDVTDDMIWSVDTLTRDGVLALRNMASGAYLDQGNRWYLNPSYPEPLYVRHLNNNGSINFFHRANINNAVAQYLYIWFQSGNKAEGTVDRYQNDATKAANFDIYQRVRVRSVDVAVTNRTTRYPIAIKSVGYPAMSPLPGVEFSLYTQDGFESTGTRRPLFASLVAGEDGYLSNGGNGSLIELGAGTYYLCRTNDLEAEGYAPLAPMRFTITRGGTLRVAKESQEISGFAYAATGTFADETRPVLQVPAHKGATLELRLELAGDLADMTREFAFEMSMPEGVQEIAASIGGVTKTLTSDDPSFLLSHGQSVVLEEVPVTARYVLRQTSDRVASDGNAAEGMYVPSYEVSSAKGTVTVTPNPGDLCEFTLADIVSTVDEPACVTITNTLEDFDAPDTGIDDNASVWAIVVLMSLVTLVMLRGGSIARRWQGR